MKRKDDELRTEIIEPDRIEYATQQIQALGYEVTLVDDTTICFYFEGKKVTMFPYTGWHTGKSITDGRGIYNLLKQIKK